MTEYLKGADESCEIGEHEWELVHDWFGDPSIPNGTQSIVFMRCANCGEQKAPDRDDL